MKFTPLAVLFDWDNTLVDTKYNISNATQHTIDTMGYNYTITEKSFHASRKDYMVSLFGKQWKKASEIYQIYLDQSFLQNITLNPNVEEMLRTLKYYNVYTAVVSNKKNTNLRKEVSYFKLSSYFNKVVGSGDTPQDKPHATPLLFALDKSSLPINKHNVFFVGDSITDILCAQNANCLPIIYSPLPIVDYVGLLHFQYFDKLTLFIVKYLENQ